MVIEFVQERLDRAARKIPLRPEGRRRTFIERAAESRRYFFGGTELPVAAWARAQALWGPRPVSMNGSSAAGGKRMPRPTAAPSRAMMLTGFTLKAGCLKVPRTRIGVRRLSGVGPLLIGSRSR